MRLRHSLRYVAILLTAGALLLALSVRFGDAIEKGLLSLYGWEIAWLAPEFRIRSLNIEDDQHQRVVALHVQTIRYVGMGLRGVPAGVDLNASTLLAHALQPAIIVFVILLAWPVATWRRKFYLALVSVPFIVLVLALDVPFVLLGSIEEFLQARLDPTHMMDTPLAWWMLVMDGGGRLALGLAVALSIIACGRSPLKQPSV